MRTIFLNFIPAFQSAICEKRLLAKNSPTFISISIVPKDNSL
jgi:hypothetical protein